MTYRMIKHTLFWSNIFAPDGSNTLTTSSWPFQQAKCKAVHPSWPNRCNCHLCTKSPCRTYIGFRNNISSIFQQTLHYFHMTIHRSKLQSCLSMLTKPSQHSFRIKTKHLHQFSQEHLLHIPTIHLQLLHDHSKKQNAKLFFHAEETPNNITTVLDHHEIEKVSSYPIFSIHIHSRAFQYEVDFFNSRSSSYFGSGVQISWHKKVRMKLFSSAVSPLPSVVHSY